MEINFYGPMLRGQRITIDNNWNDLLAVVDPMFNYSPGKFKP